MEQITLGQIATTITLITVIFGFFFSILKWFNKTIYDKIENFEQRITTLENSDKTKTTENKILLKAQLACLKGLQKQGCNGPVTQSINEIEAYLLEQAHR